MKKPIKVMLLMSIFFSSHINCTDTNPVKKNVTLSRLSIIKIKTLEVEFKKQINNRNLIKTAIIAASGITACALIANEFILKKNIPEQTYNPLQAQQATGPILIEYPGIKDRFKTRIIDSLAIGTAGSLSYIIFKSFGDIKNWWQTKNDKETFYLSESIKNLDNLIHFLKGIYELKNNTSYKEFYLKQIEKTHALFINSIENLIAATLAINTDKNIREDLLNSNNGLIIETNCLSKNLEDKIYTPNQINLNEQIIENLVENIISCLKRFQRDFNK